MNFSPLKSSLFQFDFRSSNKKVVSCDINSWMETHAKPTIPLNRPIKNCRNIRLNNVSSERTNFSKLKEMKSSLLKNTVRKFSQRSPLTADSDHHTNNSNHLTNSLNSIRILSVQKPEMKPIKIIQVSQFKEFDNHSTVPHQIGAGQRKFSLLRLRALSKKGARPNINHLLLGKEADIIQNKVTEKQYCGLKFVARRLSSKLKH